MIRTQRVLSASAVFLASWLVLAESPPAPAQSAAAQYHVPRPARSVAEVLLLTAQEPAPAAVPGDSELTITVLEGENGVNIIKRKTAVKPVVEVRDRNKLPVAGAAVTFTLPGMGAGGTFANGAKVLTVITDSSGRAAVTSLHPLGTGVFKITVTATMHGHLATAVISQTNYLTVAAAQAAGASAGAAAAGGGLSGLAIGGIIAGAAAVAVVAAKVATGGKSGSTQAAASLTLTPGAPAVGAPH